MDAADTPDPSPRSSRPARWPRAAALSLLAAVALLPVWLRTQPVPLVLVVVFDALRADHLSQYGYHRPTSPGLDALVSRATLFERAYAPASYTTASTASLFTGLAPERHGATLQGARLDPSHRTFAELLAESGYVARGVSFNPVVADATGFTQGFRDFAERERGSPFNLYPDIRQGLARIRGWLAEGSAPQLVFFQVMNTHGPYLVPESASQALLGRPPRPEFQYYRPPMSEIVGGDLARRAAVTPGYVSSAVERYDTAIRYATDQLGAFLDELDRQGRLDDALVVVTSDHGDEFFEHGGFSHGYTLHEEVVRVPLILKLPGQREARRVAARVSLMDVLPTLADAVGAETPEGLDGESLLPLARGEAPGPPRTLHLGADFAPRLVARGRIEGRHKLIAIEESYEGLEWVLRLYDLESDPAERDDLAPERPELAQALLSRLLAHDRSRQALAAPPAARAEALDRERLRALGYVE